MKDDNTKTTGFRCDLDSQRCRPCIMSKVLLAVVIGYALFYLFVR